MKFLFGPVLSAWHAYKRRLDMQTIWPKCVEEANKRGHDINFAKAGFALHAFNDASWQELGTRGILAAIDRLAPYTPAFSIKAVEDNANEAARNKN